MLTEPLAILLRKDEKFLWSAACQEAFYKIKLILLSEPVFMAPNFEKPFKLFVDASDVGMGSVLLQEAWIILCAIIQEGSSHQCNYSTAEKEMLALVLSLQHFEVYVSSSVVPVQIYTDHNPLVYIQHMKNQNKQLLRWGLFPKEYRLEIQHAKGCKNVVADALSRAV